MIKGKSFTLVEVLTIVGILIVLTAISIPAFRFFQKESDLNNSIEEIINTLRLAQNKTLASEEASQWGVYFDIYADPHQYTLFKGVNYLSRNPSFDKIHKLPKTVEIYEINLVGGNEVVFGKVTGIATPSGSISLRLKTDLTKTKTVYIENSGRVSETLPVVPSDASRIKDSRHIHFNYSRFIDTAGETLTLMFNGSIRKDILISGNLEDGQISWEGEVDVDGEVQKIKIHTHKLNSPDSQFCIHRNRRYNNKILEVTLSGDSSGYLIHYSADGLTTDKGSIYSSDPEWQ